jgi:zinc/manganese transport system substrate-binding protein
MDHPAGPAQTRVSTLNDFFMKRSILVLLAVFGAAFSAHAEPLKIVTSIPDLADFARRVGGDRVEVFSLASGVEDPHYVQLKPSMIPRLRQADLFIQMGLGLEDAYAPALVRESRNAKLKPGGIGFLDMSRGVRPLEIPRSVDRAGGDIHPYGNPHYNLDPVQAQRMVAAIADRLAKLDPENSGSYQSNARSYNARLEAKLHEWKQRLRGKSIRFVSYHPYWAYFAARFDVDAAGTIQPKPGIEPGPRHIKELAEMMKQNGVRLIVKESFYSDRVPNELAKRTGARVVSVPIMVGGTRKASDYISFMDIVVDAFAGS